MIRYVRYLETKSRNDLLSHGLGDWFDLGPGSPGPSQLTPAGLTATAIYYYDLSLLTQDGGYPSKRRGKSLSFQHGPKG